MRYGKFINKGILVRESPAYGYKPIVETAPETPKDHRAIFHYEDNGDSIVTVWEYIALTEEEKDEIAAHEVPSAEDYEQALAELGVRL